MKAPINFHEYHLLFDITTFTSNPSFILYLLGAVFITYRIALANERYRRYKSFQNLLGGLFNRMAGGTSPGATSSSGSFSFIYIVVVIAVFIFVFKKCDIVKSKGATIQRTFYLEKRDAPNNSSEQKPHWPIYNGDSDTVVKPQHIEQTSSTSQQEGSMVQQNTRSGRYTLQIVAASHFERVYKKGKLIYETTDFPLYLYESVSLTHLLIGNFKTKEDRARAQSILERKLGQKLILKDFSEMDEDYIQRLY